MNEKESRPRQQAAEKNNVQPILPDFPAKVRAFQQAVDPAALELFAKSLGVSVKSLRAVGIGWDNDSRRWTFPERDADGQVIGIATRDAQDRKRCVPGSKRGLTMAWPLGSYAGSSSNDPILIVEGASDTTAGSDLGFVTIGRPNATGGLEYLKPLLRERYVVIVGENDKNGAGRKGAEKMARGLVGVAASVKVIFPPTGAKDLRVWFTAPAPCTHDELLALIQRTEPLSPNTTAESINESGNEDHATHREKRLSQADLLVELANNLQVFHTPGHDGDGYAEIPVNGHVEIWPINSKTFRRWLGRRFYEEFRKVPSAQALQDALGVVSGPALFEGPAIPVHVRVAEHEGILYLDLANDNWQAVEIAADGWRVVDNPPVKFIRKRGMLPLPIPVKGGQIDDLRSLVNVPDDDQWFLLVGWLLCLFRPNRPFPVLCVQGEQGSAKSTLCKMVRALIDPNVAPLRRPPRDDRDLMIAAKNGWVVAFENLSGVPGYLSDGLCTLATGGGYGARELYSDDDEKLFDSMRPVILNGIDDLATRSDLRDRAIVLTLPVIPEESRQDEDFLWKKFSATQPRVLGALLDGVVTALKKLHTIQLERKPRMADFAKWVVAAEPALGWEPGRFMRAYQGNQDESHAQAIETSAVGPAILSLMATQTSWYGTWADLLEELQSNHISEEIQRSRDCPKNPKGLSSALRRLVPNLRNLGIHVKTEREAGGNRRRVVRIEKATIKPSQQSQPSQDREIKPDTPGRLLHGGDGSPTAETSNRPAPNRCLHEFRDDWDGRDGCDRVNSDEGVEPVGPASKRRVVI